MTSTAVGPTPTAKPAAGPAPGPECPDVLIIGGGPAGCAAAIVLAQQ
ncbi:MAG: hydroxylase, partial [Xanthomonas perforans]|nr:hydroxylase [Xanthomonas perforans]